jgi:hypothetical protein
VDVHVPAGAPAGNYRGELTVTANATNAVKIPIDLQVWNFTLPSRPSLRTNFGDVREIGRFFDVWDGPEYDQIDLKYNKMLIQHRVMPHRPAGTAPAAMADGSIDTSVSHARLAYYLDELGVNSWSIRFDRDSPFDDPLGADRARAIKYLRQLYQYLDDHGWAERVYAYFLDEPESAEQYEDVRDFAALVREANPNIKLLVTEQPTPDDPNWGSLHGSVDIWVPIFGRYDAPSAQARQAAGDAVWAYTAGWLCSECPTWQVDFPLIHHRIPTWIIWANDIQGLLYWSTTYWNESSDPWTDVQTYGQHNGDGALIYPGNAVGYEGPLPSIRLKAVRQAMQDYEYLKLLSDKGGKADADRIVANIATDFYSWNSKIADLLAAREAIAQHIETR